MREENVGFKLRMIHNQIHRQMEHKRCENEGDLTAMQRFVIGFLRDHEGKEIYQKDIETAFSISRATASNMLQVMERKGLLVRIQQEHDARLKKIILTDQARQMVERAKHDVEEMEASLLKGMSEEDIRLLHRFLDRMIQNIGAKPVEPIPDIVEEKPRGKNGKK